MREITLNVSELVGKVINSISVEECEIIFVCSDGTRYKMFHEQDCCETVSLEETIGDFNNLIGSPIVMAEEVTSFENQPDKRSDSRTWTFYKFATAKGYVTLRWLGESNGCYSEGVDFVRLINKEA